MHFCMQLLTLVVVLNMTVKTYYLLTIPASVCHVWAGVKQKFLRGGRCTRSSAMDKTGLLHGQVPEPEGHGRCQVFAV